MKTRPVYLDCAATTPTDRRVAELVMRLMVEEFGNPASRTHVWGIEAKKLVDDAREQVASAIGSDLTEVVFTSGATEANNLAIFGLVEYGLANNKRHIISSQIEHSAILEPMQEMVRRGFEITLMPPASDGKVSADTLASALRPDTLLVSVMHVNNETGIIQPISSYCEVLADHPAFLHTDAAQSFGKILGPLKNPRLDMISISGHKFNGPKGSGALITRRRKFKRLPLKPLFYGGKQEFGLRPGTVPVPLVAGLGLAVELAMSENEIRKIKCQEVGRALSQVLTGKGFVEVGKASERIHGIAAYSSNGIDSESVILGLKDVVSISNGAACSSMQYKESHVYAAMAEAANWSQTVTRWSWDHNTEIDLELLENRLAF